MTTSTTKTPAMRRSLRMRDTGAFSFTFDMITKHRSLCQKCATLVGAVAFPLLNPGNSRAQIGSCALPPSNPFAQPPYVARPVALPVLPLIDTPLGGMVTEPLVSTDPDGQKRRSTRIVQAVPITVTGVDALGQPFKERTTTVMVNCHGCKYQSKHYVPKNSMVTLEVPRPEAGQKRTTQGRVVWVQRPRTVRELFQIGLEFEVPGNVWGIAFPPEDWFSSPYETGVETSKPVAANEPKLSVTPPSVASTSPAPTAVPREHKTETPNSVLRAPASAPAKPVATEQQVAVPPAIAGARTPATPRPPQELESQQPPVVEPPQGAATPTPVNASVSAGDEGKIHVVPASSAELQGPLARQMAQMVDEVKEKLDKSLRRGAEAAITEEMAIARQQLDSQLHEAIERAIKVSMERVSESSVRKVVQQAAERTAAIVDEARKATEASAIHLDEKIREAVQQAVSGAADQAAQQAAQQAAEKTAAHSLKQAVEEA